MLTVLLMHAYWLLSYGCPLHPTTTALRLCADCERPLQAAAQHVTKAIQDFASSPGSAGGSSASVPVTVQQQPFQASAYGQPDPVAAPATAGSGTAGRRLQELGFDMGSGLTESARRLHAAARWLGWGLAEALARGKGRPKPYRRPYRRALADGASGFVLPVPPQPAGAGGQPGGPGGPTSTGAGGTNMPPTRQSWTDVVQQSTPAAALVASNPPAAPQQNPGAADVTSNPGVPPPEGLAGAAPAPAPGEAAGAPAPGHGIAFWLPPLTVEGYKLPAIAVPELPAPPPPPLGR